jgi:hypothetical protein
MTLRIENHQLVGELVSHRSTPKHVLGREQDEAARYVLTARSLNIRKGPRRQFRTCRGGAEDRHRSAPLRSACPLEPGRGRRRPRDRGLGQ